MHPFGSYVATHIHRSQHEDDWRAADRWRRLNQRPDAPPLPTPERPGRLDRVLAALRMARRSLDPRLPRRLEDHGHSGHAR